MVAKPNQREFWRILNAAADTYFDLQVLTGPSLAEALVPLTARVSRHGWRTGRRRSGSGTHGRLLAAGSAGGTHLDYAAGRSFRSAGHASLRYGPDGESTPSRVIANLFSTQWAPAPASQHARCGDLAVAWHFLGLIGRRTGPRKKAVLLRKAARPGQPEEPADLLHHCGGTGSREFSI